MFLPIGYIRDRSEQWESVAQAWWEKQISYDKHNFKKGTKTVFYKKRNANTYAF